MLAEDTATEVMGKADLAACKRQLDEQGYCLIEGALDPERLARTRKRLVEQAALEKAEGWGLCFDKDSQAVVNLMSKGQDFIDLVEAPAVLELIEHVIGKDPLISSITCNIVGEGMKAQVLHGDQAIMPAPWPTAMVCNVAWLLDDFTADNGATVIVPGSHKVGNHPDYENLPVAEPVIAQAGSAMVFDGRLWHGAGENRTPKRRHALLAYYCAPWLRQQENMFLSLAPHVVENASPRLRDLIGYKSVNKLGTIVR